MVNTGKLRLCLQYVKQKEIILVYTNKLVSDKTVFGTSNYIHLGSNERKWGKLIFGQLSLVILRSFNINEYEMIGFYFVSVPDFGLLFVVLWELRARKTQLWLSV